MRPTRFHSRFVAQLGAVASVLVVLGAAGTASARDTFPGIIQDFTKGKCVPECTLCHTRQEGGRDFLKPSDISGVLPDRGGARGQGEFFANLIHVNGGTVFPGDEARLRGYLTGLKTKSCNTDASVMPPVGPCDSDGDGLPDVAELTADRNPDTKDAAGGGACPQYGCGANIGTLPRESAATGRAAALMALLGAGLVLAARRSRR